MMGHKICFVEEIWVIIPNLSLLLLFFWSTGYVTDPKCLLRRLHYERENFIFSDFYCWALAINRLKLCAEQVQEKCVEQTCSFYLRQTAIFKNVTHTPLKLDSLRLLHNGYR